MLENGTGPVRYFGYLADGTPAPDPAAGNAEASKTEPDKNTYLRLSGLHGADPTYDHGRRFVFQGHEGGRAGYITRVNLDADPAHRVTLLATTLADGMTPIPAIDGSPGPVAASAVHGRERQQRCGTAVHSRHPRDGS